MRRSFLIPTLFFALGCSEPVDMATAEANLTTQTEAIFQATLKKDHGALADLTHPKIVEMAGGRTGFIRKLKELETEFEATGVSFVSMTPLGEPEVAQNSGDLYAVVRYELRLGQGGVPITSTQAALFGYSADGGQRWSFVDASGVGGDRDKLKQVLPDYPAALPVPAPSDTKLE